jgi:NodT family efflux transporter outer membrane factor (OMF) lipoprotein
MLQAVAAAAVFLAAGCATVGPDYRKPDVPVPSAWNRGGASDNTATAAPAGDLSRWWERLGDETLTGLIDQALSGSTDLRTAMAKLREARARRGLAGAEMFPTVKASASGSRARGSEETGSGDTTSLYSAGFDAAWEPDIFGGTRRGVEAAQADLETAEADLHDAQVSLAAEVALNYVEARSYQEKLAIAERNLASQSETHQLTDWRAQAGLATSLDVEQARSNLEQTRAKIPTLTAGLAEAEHRLAVLLGRAPGAVRETLASPAPVPAVPDSMAVGIPADAVGSRPDVRSAERKLAAETARVGQAIAARYPGLSLDASIGVEALTLGALDAGSAVTRSLLGTLAGVVFDGGRLRRQVEIQDAVQEQALIAYEAAVLTALEDVENALVSLSENRKRKIALAAAVEAARNAALLARYRYTAGLIDFQTVLDTERTQLTVEESLATAEADGATALIRLYKALGGGWSRTESGGKS